MNDRDVEELALRLKKFASARNWEKFHTPKNLAMALGVEIAELTEIFQWLTPEESQSVMGDSKLGIAVRDELADVLIYLVRLASVLDVDLIEVANGKIDRNEIRFPTN